MYWDRKNQVSVSGWKVLTAFSESLEFILWGWGALKIDDNILFLLFFTMFLSLIMANECALRRRD